MITLIEQQTLDIDWFFTAGNEIGFVASGGGRLPKSVASKSFEEVEFLSDYFRNLPERSEVAINPNLKAIMPAREITRQYLEAFSEMAEKGLSAFDKTVLNNFSDTNHHLVARPLRPLTIGELPSEIAELLIKSQHSLMTAHLNGSSFSFST